MQSTSETTFQRLGKAPLAILLSIIWHALFVLIIALLGQLLPKSSHTLLQDKKGPIFKVETIKPEQLKKYRTVGVKNGSKDFSVPTPKGKLVPVKKPAQGKKGKAQNKSLSLADLTVNKKVVPKSTREAKPLPKKESGIRISSNHSRAQKVRQAQLQGSILRQEAASSQAAAEALSNNSFGMDLEPPEGVSEDELNSSEKIFYSFHKRTYQNYLGSFVQTYHRLLRQRPTIQVPLREQRHRLTAKVTYDEQGNIVKIKIIQSSKSDEIHDLFEDTLRDMKGLPNPPKALIKKDGEFTVYYKLNINS